VTVFFAYSGLAQHLAALYLAPFPSTLYCKIFLIAALEQVTTSFFCLLKILEFYCVLKANYWFKS